MLLKLGVDISRLSDPMRRVLNRIDEVCISSGGEAVVTSTYEGTHSPGSLHYVNRAIDLRLMPNSALVCDKIRKALGTAYDVVLEKDHIHVEFDPR
jgi:hypothetical protein